MLSLRPNCFTPVMLCGLLGLILSCEPRVSPPAEEFPFQTVEVIQLTHGSKGHFLHQDQYFSPDQAWIVYDTRNDGSEIGKTCCIEMVHTATQEVRSLYQTPHPTKFGPGVGATTFSPRANRVLFIHGLSNADSLHPYDFARRTGVAVDLSRPGILIQMDARDVHFPFTPGALRGGTHAHGWSGDGRWVSFTYNDAVLRLSPEAKKASDSDFRSVGVMAPFGPVEVDPVTGEEDLSGERFAFLVTRLTEQPQPGTDQIDRAYEEGWIGQRGYARPDGTQQWRALAFLGDLRDHQGRKLTEVFVVDLPTELAPEKMGVQITGTSNQLPAPPLGVEQRRLTFTAHRTYPGVQGPRHWLKSVPDGRLILCLMKDDSGRVQIYAVPPEGGDIFQVTHHDFSIQTAFSIGPKGRYVVYGHQGAIYLTEIATGESRLILEPPSGETSGLRAIA
ncbi:MAG: DUF3748 domain-containing protein, partial [Bacteroidota bacterium]